LARTVPRGWRRGALDVTPPTPPSRDPAVTGGLEALALPFAPATEAGETTHWLRWVQQQVSDLPYAAVDLPVRDAVVSLVRGMGALALPPMPAMHIACDHGVVTLRWALADEFVVARVRRQEAGLSTPSSGLRFEGQWHRPLRGADMVCETYRTQTAAHLLSHMWPGLESLRQLAELQATHVVTIERILQEADLYCVARLQEVAGIQVYGAEASVIARGLGGRSEGTREILELLLAAHGESADGQVFPVAVRGRYLWAADQLRDGVVLPLTRARREAPRWRTGPASSWVRPTRWSAQA